MELIGFKKSGDESVNGDILNAEKGHYFVFDAYLPDGQGMLRQITKE